MNVSGRSLTNDTLIATIVDALERHGAHPSRLEVELTETALVADEEHADHVLDALADLGVQLAVDDFGTGYSSLALLSRFRGHRLKLDRSFVSGLPDDPRSLAIVQTVLGLGQSLGLQTLGEGIEIEAQRECLKRLGCDLVQGYLTGRPMTVDDGVALVFEDDVASAVPA